MSKSHRAPRFSQKSARGAETMLKRYLKKELRTKVQAASTSPLLKFDYAQTVREAFGKECLYYHDFRKQLDNDMHPRRPKGASYPCPVLGCDELV